ncbi:protein ANKUB1 [Amphiprion ocellaris]|uniref:Ubiquitin-like domain-containing protein n=1 Tax=Amphiprion ocellaris TaxID=80972 RepID=A0A3Q1CYB2_AMPOC|nr:protein ANKUB1 [Amphiprion ocellaris]
MRVFVCYEGFTEPLDVPPYQTVMALKQMVKSNFLVQLSDNQQVRQYLELSYGGAALHDSWALSDVAITSGSVIQCFIKTEQRPVMCVFNTVTGETSPIEGTESLLHTSVDKLTTLISVQCGIPVSTFRLRTPANVQLYDCNWLQDYAIKMGTILRLDTWDGWVEFLQGCLQGHRLTVQGHLSEEKPVMRFQLRVALYIAAWSGHLDLAGWLLERGVHAEEPVGVHPYRQWCQQTAHQDTRKCPIHAAAESGQLLILKLFVNNNIRSLACRDPEGRDPLKIAIQCGHRECACYITSKLCSVVSLPNVSLPMHIYLQIKRWVSSGKERAASNRCHYNGAAFKARLGKTLLIDGFNQPKMSSKSWKAEIKSRRGIKALPPISNLLSISHLPSKRAKPLIPSQHSAKEMQEKQANIEGRGDGVFDQKKEGNDSLGKSNFKLPPVNRENVPRLVFVGASPKSFHIPDASLESSHQCGQTLRENAVYCLTIASTFTEKPWMKQLDIARTLVRKHVHTMF